MTTDPAGRVVPNAFAHAKAEIKANLAQVSAELLEWRQTGTLRAGDFRTIGAGLREMFPHDHLSITEKLVTDAALGVAAALAPAEGEKE